MVRPLSANKLLKYFSIACWQWKQISSLMSGRSLSKWRAAIMSCSALRTHCSVILFIEHLSSIHNLTEKRIAPAQPIRENFGCSHDEVEGEGIITHGFVNAHRL